MIRYFLCMMAWAVPLPASAQDWALRGGDRVLNLEEVTRLTDGQALTFYDNGTSRYAAGGSYSYTYAGGRTAYGRYRLETDGTVCILYRNGFERCDRFVESGSRIVMLTQKGERFPVRPGVSE